ncbi:MAG TPA: sterol desaturase family protein [Ignavibacteria bacterium]|nr:sterol desaturase family protein [Ignavibacteria bacterium]
MAKSKYVSNKNETIPLFKNSFLEYFSHIHPVTPVVVYVPVILICAYFGFQRVPVVNGILAYAGGVLLWTLTEYVIHRWAFHYEPKSATGKKVHFLVHGIHHDYPRDATRLVMPLLVSVPLATLFFYIFMASFGSYYLVIFSGFVLGYVSYDSIHYATHHINLKGKIGGFLRSYHLRHHYEDDHTAYGVSTPLWDYIFRTIPSYMLDLKKVPDIEVGKDDDKKATI